MSRPVIANKVVSRAAEIAARFRAEPGKKDVFAKFSAKEGDRGQLWVYEVIGEDWWTGGGVTAKRVMDALDAMKGVKSLDIFINSEGGDLFEAKAIFTNLKRFDAEKVVHIDGIAASAATLIAMAGDRIITSSVATWMVHEAWTIAVGPADDLRATAELLDLENGVLAETYAKKTGDSVDAMRKLMKAETWMSAASALELGFTDEVEDPGEKPEEEAPAAKVSPLVAASAATRRRITALSVGQQLTAAAIEAKRPPGSPGNKR